MKSVILCEGGTDLALIQYFMETVNGWTYAKDIGVGLQIGKSRKAFIRNEDRLIIAEMGGCQNLCKGLELLVKVLTRSVADTEMIDKIVIITDRDEVNSEKQFINDMNCILDGYKATVHCKMDVGQWIECNVKNGIEDTVYFEILLLVIPFETTGALETFLLQAVSKKDVYDRAIIDKCNAFVDQVDCERKYLKKRRHITKAKFDVYFSIRTPLEQFTERRNILKNIDWKNYENVQECFKELRSLHTNKF